MSLGSNICRLRTEKNLSQIDLANALCVSRQSISKWETDGSVPELDKLLKLSRLFDITLDELVTGEKPALPSAATLPPKRSLLHSPVRIIAGGLFFASFLLHALKYLSSGVSSLYYIAFYILPPLLCGLICLAVPKRVPLWCGWIIYAAADLYWLRASGLNWRVILLTPVYDPFQNYIRLAIAWGQFLGMLLMIVWTLLSFRKDRLILTKHHWSRLLFCWGIFLLLSTLFSFHIGIDYAYLFKIAFADWPLRLMFTALLTITLCAIRGKRTA